MKLRRLLVELKNVESNQYHKEAKSVGIDRAIELIKAHCSQSMFTPLCRGSDQVDPACVVDVARIRRPGVVSNAVYNTEIVDKVPAWKKYPNRHSSMICSTNYESASEFGNVYFVFPYNNTKLAVAPASTMDKSFFSFIQLFDKPDITNSITRTLTDLLPNLNNAHAISNQLKLNINIDPSTTVDQFFNQFLTPEYNGFKLVTPDVYSKMGLTYSGMHKEVWFSGKAVMVHNKYIRYVLGSIL